MSRLLPAEHRCFDSHRLRSAKWQVQGDLCISLLPLLEPDPNSMLAPSDKPSMLEKFLDVSRLLQRGGIDRAKEEATGKRVAHPHCEKTELVSGVVHNLDFIAGIYLTVDVWEQSYGDFHHFAKSPSRYGGFEPPHLRHMMAERAVIDTLWCRRMRLKLHIRVGPHRHTPWDPITLQVSRGTPQPEGAPAALLQVCQLAACA